MTFMFSIGRIKTLVFFLFLFLFMQVSKAATCPSVFPAATTQNTGPKLNYSYPTGAVFNNFPSGILPLILGAGDYYYNGGNLPGIIVFGGPSVRLFVNGNLDISGNNDVNDFLFSKAENLIIIVKGNLKITSNIHINALIYVEGTVTISSNVVVDGAITATGIISPGTKSTITYNATAVSNANFSTLCGTSPVFDHFVISLPASASTCAAASVQVSAIDSNGATMTSYTGTVNLSTQSVHGDWGKITATNTVSNGSSDDGAATYTFASGDAGVITLSLLNTHADVTTVSVQDVATAITNTSSTVTFNNNALNIRTSSNDVVAGRDHVFTMEYLKRDPVSGSCGVLSSFSGTVALKLAYQAAASHPAGANAPVVNGIALPSALPVSSNVSLAFSSGAANFTLSTSDIGSYAFNVLDDSSGVAVNLSGAKIPITGASAIYSVRPFGLAVTVVGNPAASSAAGAVFKKAGENFDVQVRAILYQAADDSNADGLPDGHADTNPANNANLSDNGSVPSFGKEGETVSLSALLVSPAAGHDPGLSGATTITSFSSGSGSTAVGSRYDEVGVIEITATISDGVYLTSPGAVYGHSSYVGRFTPAYFSGSHVTPSLTDGWYDNNGDGSNDWTCDFTYQGQSFALNSSPQVSLTARSASGLVTQNYSASFNKLSTSSSTQKNIKFVIADNASSTAPLATLNNTATLSITDLGSGLLNLSMSGLNDRKNGISYIKSVKADVGDEVFSANYSIRFFQELNASAPNMLVVPNPGTVTPPFMFATDLQNRFDTPSFLNTDTNADGVGDLRQDLIFRDADNICYMVDTDANGIPDTCDDYVISGISGTEIRYGRLVIDNAYGSELIPLPMVFRVEYYDHITPTSPTSGFKVNALDNNTTSACVGSSLASANVTLSNYQLNLNAGESVLSSISPIQNGLGSLVFSAPGTGNQGLMQVTLTVPAWLQYDFNGDGSADMPSAVATFGVSAGSDVLFYQRENFR